MRKTTRYLGLDVHAETIAVAIAEPGRRGEVRSLGTIPNRPESVRRLIKKLGAKDLEACYEAGPCGYGLYWQLESLGVHCEVVAPTLVPVKSGERVKTDRRDALKLARCFRAGDLTAVWVPDAAHEALRDLVRAREAAKRDQLRARHRLSKLLLRHGRRPSKKMSTWRTGYMAWLRAQHFELYALQATFVDYLAQVDHATARVAQLDKTLDQAIADAPPQIRALVEALQALRGVAKLSAVTVAVEVGSLSRFESPRPLMGYSGLVPSEHSSGASTHRGGITKTGNAHLRRVLLESAWSYRHRPAMYGALRRRQQGLSEQIKAIAWKAQHRLNLRYRQLAARGKVHQQVMTAVARELLGFMWAIGVQVEQQAATRREAA